MNLEKFVPHEITRGALQLLQADPLPTENQLAALRRLVDIAQSDTGQSRRCADFLLAWWNAGSCGGFDLTDLWCVDISIAADMVPIFGLVARCREYPPAEFKDDFAALVRDWRPSLGGAKDNA